MRRNLIIDRGPATQRLHALGDAVRAAQESQAARAERFRRIAGRAENGTAPVAVSAWQLFPTPAAVAARMAAAARLGMQVADPRLRILEPSAGTGNLVRAMLATPRVLREFVTAVEVAPDVAREFARDFPAVRLVVGDFLERTAEDLGGPFDRVVMNPPFHRGEDARHILHAAEMLRPDGLLVGLCYDGRAFRDELLPRCATWERLPADSFASSGTRADVVLLTMTPQSYTEGGIDP